MRRRFGRLALSVIAASAVAPPAFPAETRRSADRAKVAAYVAANEATILHELAALLELPNLASDAAGIRRNAEFLVEALGRRKLSARLLDGEGGPPVVYGERRANGARRTIVVYAHYDGQPVDPARWSSPPFTPTLLDGPREAGGRELPLHGQRPSLPADARLYGRSASDDKGTIMALLAALDALQAVRRPLNVNLKVFLEGEEEAGSPHLRAVLEKNKDLLAADAWLFCDGPIHQSRRPLVFFGARGMMGLELTLYGAARSLHSGHYGNWAPNPAADLAALVAGLHGPDGRVLVEGFYDAVRPPSAAERAALDAAPPVEAAMRTELRLPDSATRALPLAEGILSPALNVRGIESGRVGQAAANAIPTTARASLDFRLVPDQRPEAVRAAFEAHLRKLGYEIVSAEPTPEARAAARLVRVEWDQGYPASRAPLDTPFARAVVAAVENATGAAPVRLPTLGGSLPMHVFEDVLKAPVVGLPIANHDNNQHAADENLRVQNLRDGIAIFAEVLTGMAWR